MSEKNLKKAYQPPKLIDHGSVKQMTQTTSMFTQADGGATPLDMTMGGGGGGGGNPMCLTVAGQLEEHRQLLLDVNTQRQFVEAIEQVVRPGDTVIDLGSGTGLHAMLAVRAGARKVYAIEADTVIEPARETVRRNNMADKIEFIYGHSRVIEIPEKADVIITNIGFLNTVRELPRLAEKFLKPGGKMIPESLQLTFAPLMDSGKYKDLVDFWHQPHFGFDFSVFRDYASQYLAYSQEDKPHFLASPQKLAPIDLREEKYNFSWSTEFMIEEQGRLTGLLGWYDFHLCDGVSFSTKPPSNLSKEFWSQPYFPFKHPIEVKKGQTLKLDVATYLRATMEDPIWRWDVEIDGKRFEQNNFNAMPLAKEFLQKLS